MGGLRRRLSMALVGVSGGWVGTALAGGLRRTFGPFGVSVDLRPSVRGGSVVRLPPLGEVSLDTHAGPVGVRVTLETVDAASVAAVLRRPDGLGDLRRDAEQRAPRDLGLAAVRTLVAGALGGGAVGLLTFGRARPAALSSGAAAATILAGYAVSAGSFRPAALENPTLHGLLRSVPSLEAMLRGMAADFEVYGDQLARLTRNVGRIHQAVSDLPLLPPPDELVTVLHISDLHLAPHAWKLVAAVAEQFHVEAVVDSGDTTDFGSSAEIAYLDAIRRLEVPYVWVRGNHDSTLTQEAMARIPNVVVLEGEVAEVAGLRFLGAGDPVFTPGRSHLPMDVEAEAAKAAEVAAVARAAGGVDVVVFHHPGPWQMFDGVAHTVLAGHRHARSVERSEHGTLLMALGSTGGGGLRAMQSSAVPTSIELAVLYVDRATRTLVAWDDLRVGGVGLASAAVDRHFARTAPAPASRPGR